MVLKVRFLATGAILLALVLSGAAYRTNNVPTSLTVAGFAGQAALIQKHGRWYVDVELLARILNGELSRQENHLVLRLPNAQSNTAAGSAAEVNLPAAGSPVLSHEFVNTGIETLFSMRSWATTVANMISKGYPIDASVTEYQQRASKNLSVLSASTKTDGDRHTLQLITNEFNNLQAWSDHLVEAKRALRTGNYAMSPDTLANDEQSQRIIRCWQFLGPMLASGKFQDDGSCR